MAGVDLRTVAERVGHSGIRMTMRYAHLAPQHNRTAVDRLVPLSVANRRAKKKGEKPAPREDERGTQSVANKNLSSGSLQKDRQKSLSDIDLQNVAP